MFGSTFTLKQIVIPMCPQADDTKMHVSTSTYLCFISGGPFVFKGGYHARVQKHRKRVVFQGEACTTRAVFRVSEIAKVKKKGMGVRQIKI